MAFCNKLLKRSPLVFLFQQNTPPPRVCAYGLGRAAITWPLQGIQTVGGKVEISDSARIECYCIEV